MKRRGFTVMEVMISVAVLGIITLPLARFLAGSSRDTLTTTMRVSANDSTRAAMSQIEMDLNEMNDLRVSAADRIEVLMDSNRMIGYNPRQVTAAGFSQALDPDDDGDLNTTTLAILPRGAAGTFQRYGNDLDDDDDDNDGFPDVRVVYYSSGARVIREAYYNKALTSTSPDAQSVLINNASRFTFSYSGSINETRGNSGLDDNGDGLISQDEIDDVGQSGRLEAGNDNGEIDTRSERAYVTNIEVILGEDLNRDGREDAYLKTEIAPPLLPYKNKYP